MGTINENDDDDDDIYNLFAIKFKDHINYKHMYIKKKKKKQTNYPINK